MGGGAFSQASAEGQPTLSTPRMSPDVYFKLKETYTARLRSYLPPNTHLASLTEAPEKTDYGDMDFMIAHDDRINFTDLANHLGAVAILCPDPQTCTLAVPKDGSRSANPAVVYKQVHVTGPRKLKVSAEVSEEEYAQMDIETVPTQLFEWHTFYASYGDMGGLLGYIVHNLGFTVSDRGLWLRMEELDDAKRLPYPVNVADQDGRILLSHDPAQVMQFLGLRPEVYYEAGFQTLEGLYAWLGECRLLSWDAIKLKRENSSERNREQKRTVFSRFFNEWLPAQAHLLPNGHPAPPGSATGSPPDKATTEGLALRAAASRARLAAKRAELVADAIHFFAKQHEFETMHTALVRNVRSAIAAQLLKPILALHSGKTNKNLTEIVRAFRRHVGIGEQGQPDGRLRLEILERARTDAQSELWRLVEVDGVAAAGESGGQGGCVGDGEADGGGGGAVVYGLKEAGRVSEWAKEHWEEVRGLERLRMKGLADGRD
ncbi:hypothetical protein LTR36_004493 [Oleoguttula mirabilis]|uniref:Uncharacterized protein n=1 Tax=Oleoguttula mirabilis TaxID=1507867 RepID=A0AAV9JGI6_9PEZI|nr:hypothetical protein LTR36_004493 [Oleoguttula mirabilis]